MSDGNDNPDPDESPEEGVLDPDDLDIRDRKEVDEPEEGRYVISTESGGSAVDETGEDSRRIPRNERNDTDDERPPLDALAADLDAVSAPHGLALAGKTERGTASIQFAATDPAEVLGAAVRWYAKQVDPDADANETAARLLEAAGLDSGKE